MKIYLAVVLALGLSGCADIDLFGDGAGADQASASAPEPAADSSPAPQASASGMAAAEQTNDTAPQQPATMSEPPVVSAARAAPAPSAAVSAHCKTLARLRASDAAFQGEDPETQDAVYSTTYSDCVAWDAAHRS